MATPRWSDERPPSQDAAASRSPAPPAPAWERLEEGRYRPRRTRGSFPGRELG